VCFNDKNVRVPLDHLQYAHAITVHKSQGDEYPFEILILPKCSKFITKQLVYTGITRAKHHLYIIAEKDTLIRCSNNTRQSRRTLLNFMIKGLTKRTKFVI
jgi:exodeoxyribonuclease V alpha subunit